MKSELSTDPFYAPLVRTFVSELHGSIDEILSYVESKQSDLAQSACHKLAGTAATYGFPDLAGKLGELEIILEGRDPKNTDTDLICLQIKQIESRILNSQH